MTHETYKYFDGERYVKLQNGFEVFFYSIFLFVILAVESAKPGRRCYQTLSSIHHASCERMNIRTAQGEFWAATYRLFIAYTQPGRNIWFRTPSSPSVPRTRQYKSSGVPSPLPTRAETSTERNDVKELSPRFYFPRPGPDFHHFHLCCRANAESCSNLV